MLKTVMRTNCYDRESVCIQILFPLVSVRVQLRAAAQETVLSMVFHSDKEKRNIRTLTHSCSNTTFEMMTNSFWVIFF